MSRVISPALAAGVIGGVTVLWILSGLVSTGTKNTLHGNQDKVPISLQKVRVQEVVAAEQITYLTVSGRTKPNRTVTVRGETSGQVEEVLVEKGAKVSSGEVIVHLKEEERPVRLNEARTLVERRSVEYEAAKALEQKAFVSRVRLAETRAELNAARAQLAHIQSDLEHTHVRAPFSGVVSMRQVEVGDFVAVGSVIATLVDLDPIIVVSEVTEREVATIAIGTPATALLINGMYLSGTVSYVAIVATPATHTFTVEVAISNRSSNIPAGMTAEVSLPLQPRLVHAIPPSALTLDEFGRVGLKAVTETGKVVFYPVTLSGEGKDGTLWVTGSSIPSTIHLITLGQEIVTSGQMVEAVTFMAPKATSL